jgi:hypothetical protein
MTLAQVADENGVGDVRTTPAHNESSRVCGVQPKRLGTKDGKMKIVGCDLHARQQTRVPSGTKTGFVVNWIDHDLQLPACAVLAAGIRFL